MRTLASFALALVGLIASTVLAAAPLRPAGPWAVNYADNMCVLSRQFGTGEGQVALAFRPGPMSDHMRVGLLTRDKSTKVARGQATLRIDALPPVEASFQSGPTLEKGIRVIAIDTKRSEIAGLEKASMLHISAEKAEYALAPTGLAAAMKALTACELDLLKTWGMDPAVVASIVIRPTPKDAVPRYFMDSDYPSEAMRAGEQGTVGIRFMVGTDGKPKDCQVIESSGSRSLDKKTCSIALSRISFVPAKTSDGTAVASLSFLRIRWTMPN